MTTVGPDGATVAETRRPTRALVSGGPFWLIVPGIGCALLALTEGSPLWATFVVASAYLGFAGGYASGDSLLAMIRRGAESGYKPAAGDVVWGAFGVRNLVLFWVPQMLFLYVSVQVA